MAIKIYQSQIRPTEEIGAVPTTPGMRVSMETASALGAASSQFTGAVTDFFVEKEKVKAETEVLEKKEKIYNGDENVPGLSKVKVSINPFTTVIVPVAGVKEETVVKE